jgi:hypothetical protein
VPLSLSLTPQLSILCSCINPHLQSFIGHAEEKKAAKAEQDRLRALKGKGPAQPEEDEDDDDEDADVVSVPLLLQSTKECV